MSDGAEGGVQTRAGSRVVLRNTLLAIAVLGGCQAVQPNGLVPVLARQSAVCPDPARPGGAQVSTFVGAAGWQAHLASLNSDLRSGLWSWRVDFSAGQSVALVSGGSQPNPGYRVTVSQDSLSVRDGVLQVKAQLVAPPKGTIQAQVISFPCVYLHLDAAGYRESAVQLVQ
ncbi:MAG: protease complex subunit PrcB family protein [Lautropia sp.]